MTLDLPICCNFQKNLQMAKGLQLAQTFFVNGQRHYLSKHHQPQFQVQSIERSNIAKHRYHPLANLQEF